MTTMGVTTKGEFLGCFPEVKQQEDQIRFQKPVQLCELVEKPHEICLVLIATVGCILAAVAGNIGSVKMIVGATLAGVGGLLFIISRVVRKHIDQSHRSEVKSKLDQSFREEVSIDDVIKGFPEKNSDQLFLKLVGKLSENEIGTFLQRCVDKNPACTKNVIQNLVDAKLSPSDTKTLFQLLSKTPDLYKVLDQIPDIIRFTNLITSGIHIVSGKTEAYQSLHTVVLDDVAQKMDAIEALLTSSTLE